MGKLRGALVVILDEPPEAAQASATHEAMAEGVFAMARKLDSLPGLRGETHVSGNVFILSFHEVDRGEGVPTMSELLAMVSADAIAP